MRIVERRIVLDTNVLISRLLLPHGISGRAVDKALSWGVMLVSDETLAELADVLARPKFDRYVSRADRQQFLRLLGGVARKIRIQPPGNLAAIPRTTSCCTSRSTARRNTSSRATAIYWS